MNNEIKIFESQQFGKIRTSIIDSEPWFVGKDVAIALGYGNDGKSAINAVSRHVHDDDKGVTEIMTPGGLQKNNHHQRIRPVRADLRQQAPQRKGIQAMDHA